MKNRSLNTKGFGLVGILAIILVILILCFTGWLVWHKNHDTKKDAHSQQPKTNTANNGVGTDNAPKPVSDTYEGWLDFKNDAYGITFKYPGKWDVDEGAMDSPDSATKQAYAINLKRKENVKYNNTASLEVLNQNMASAAGWYDSYFAQSAQLEVTKTPSTIQGRPAISYTVVDADSSDPNADTIKVHLLSVGNKTYAFSSVNESSNTQTDTSYWKTFDSVFESIQIK